MRSSSSQGWFLLLALLTGGVGSAYAIDVQIGTNFTGSSLSQSGFIPPDTMGAVGPSHIVELINGRFAVYDKIGNPIASSSLDIFWASAGAAPTSFSFDPRILYDPTTDRWYATSVDNAGAANNFLVAVSNSGNPTSGWAGFKIDSDSDNGQWADFPTMGYDRDGVYIAANMFNVGPNTFHSVSLLTLPKADLVAGSTANRKLFQNMAIGPGQIGFAPQPVVDLDDTGLPARLVGVDGFLAGMLDHTNINGPINNPTLSAAGTSGPTPPGGTPPNADQPGPKQNIHTGDIRLSSNVVRRNGNLWGVRSVESGGRSALQWFKVRESDNALLQQGLISDPNLSFYYGSIAVNEEDAAVIGFSGSGANRFVSSYAAVGETLAGVTTFGSPLLLKAGVDDYQRLDGFGRNRWGDYSATVIDPNHPFIFWTFQEWVSADDQWSIQITELRLGPAIPEPGTLALFALGMVVVGCSRRRRKG